MNSGSMTNALITLSSTAQARTIAAVCGECEAQIYATHKPDFCGACGCIDGPWVLLIQRSVMRGASMRLDLRFRLVGTWRPAQRAQAEADLGDRLDGC